MRKHMQSSKRSKFVDSSISAVLDIASVFNNLCLGPFNGPMLEPLIGGFVYEYRGWRWKNWIVLVLFFTEPIVWFINVWNALIYGILYLCFVAYPVVFAQHRGWSLGLTGKSYLGIGAGIVLAIALESIARRIISSRPRDIVTGKPSPEVAAPIMVVDSGWPLGSAWTCLSTRIDWIVPILLRVPSEFVNTLSFLYSSNYLGGAYDIYAASALASNAIILSLFGAMLPWAGAKIYETMSPQWAGTLCGMLAVAMISVPFVFCWYGAKIRGKSRTIRQLREQQEAMDAKMTRRRQIPMSIRAATGSLR